MRLRTDDWHDAGRWRAVLLGANEDPRQNPSAYEPGWADWLETHEPAKPGDVWAIRQNLRPGTTAVMLSWTGDRNGEHWPVVAYALTCPVPRCPEGAHVWHHAHDCPAGSRLDRPCKRTTDDDRPRYSCWDWTGSPLDGSLAAAPSLQVLASNGKTCEFHGFLRAGVLA